MAGVLVCPQPEAVNAGKIMLEQGGNAIDAAIATAFAQGVADPIMTSVGGNGTMQIFHAESGQHIVIDFYGKAPLKATPDMWTDKVIGRLRADFWELEGHINQVGYLAVTTPGTVLALYEAYQRFGKLPWNELLQPAIELAAKGFIVPAELSETMSRPDKDGLSGVATIMRAVPAAKKVFTNDGTPLQTGELFQMKDYSETLKIIAKQGPAAIYKGGELGQAIIEDFKKNGGLLTEKDFESYQLSIYEPVRGNYRGYEVCGNGPPGSGMQIIETLNILENLNLQNVQFGSPEYSYMMAMAQRAGFVDRDKYLGDPDFQGVPVEQLISTEHANNWAEKIRNEELFDVEGLAVPESKETTTVSAMDSDGNALAITHTLGSPCSGVVVEGLGFIFNNSMHVFQPYTGHPNSLAPGKSRTTGMSPTLVLKDKKPVFVTSAPGAVKILTGNLNAIVNFIDYGMTATEAVAAPRIHSEGGWVDVETRLYYQVHNYLEEKGLKIVKSEKSYDPFFSLVHAVSRDPKSNVLSGGADPRGRGGWVDVQ
ncbi:MAG: gamma-glutamyltransferase [Chloroflexi bacterium]|nr:gamma-glutamyltransferase [Chloroflexota bacterium]|tara:strand:- start:94 stop:1710 length:1617 start_codon:yes stop_codon:yes gene_type:complete